MGSRSVGHGGHMLIETCALHRRFAEHRVAGEWFLADAVLSAIERIDA